MKNLTEKEIEELDNIVNKFIADLKRIGRNCEGFAFMFGINKGEVVSEGIYGRGKGLIEILHTMVLRDPNFEEIFSLVTKNIAIKNSVKEAVDKIYKSLEEDLANNN